MDSNPNIVSNINLHTYGNMWVNPFNYSEDKNSKELKTSFP